MTVTDEQIKEFIEMFGDKLPKIPNQHPLIMKHYWRMYLKSKGKL